MQPSYSELRIAAPVGRAYPIMSFLLGDMMNEITYARKTELMNPNMGRNVDLVLLDAREKRKVVAADTGVE